MRKNILERLERIDRLIRIKGTGSPAELAARLKMSERNIYQYLNLMRDLGAPIKFDPYRETYYYSEEGQFIVCFQRFDKEEDHPTDNKTTFKKSA
jgi:predicted DNA-binding transcriptional regulator YafY